MESRSLIQRSCQIGLFRTGRGVTVAQYYEHARLLNGTLGFIDLFWPGMLLVGWKSASATSSPAAGVSGTFLKGSKAS